MFQQYINEIFIFLLPFIRTFGGWIQKSLRDGKIQKYEVKRLLETFVRMGITFVLSYMGLRSQGLQNPELIAGIAAFIVDKFNDDKKDN